GRARRDTGQAVVLVLAVAVVVVLSMVAVARLGRRVLDEEQAQVAADAAALAGSTGGASAASALASANAGALVRFAVDGNDVVVVVAVGDARATARATRAP
ncbi:MAG: hypothetical protein RJA49_80, partial [Actinomycetota bacterium]